MSKAIDQPKIVVTITISRLNGFSLQHIEPVHGRILIHYCETAGAQRSAAVVSSCWFHYCLPTQQCDDTNLIIPGKEPMQFVVATRCAEELLGRVINVAFEIQEYELIEGRPVVLFSANKDVEIFDFPGRI